MKVINLQEKFGKFSDHWDPKLVTTLNNQAVKLAKVQGEFVWHDHVDEDELFFVIKGTLVIHFRDHSKTIKEGEMIVVPKGVEHKPFAKDEVWLMLFEPMSTKHTGDIVHDVTQQQMDSI